LILGEQIPVDITLIDAAALVDKILSCLLMLLLDLVVLAFEVLNLRFKVGNFLNFGLLLNLG
jgi:hypothetical protein